MLGLLMMEAAAKSRTAVIYYSRSKNTKGFAKEIAKTVDADIFEVKPVKKYSKNYLGACLQWITRHSNQEIKEIKDLDLSKYDTIYIGTPVWYWTISPPIQTFLKNNDLSGKKIIPFCTSGSGNLKYSYDRLTELCPNSEIAQFGSFRNDNHAGLQEWIKAEKTFIIPSKDKAEKDL